MECVPTDGIEHDICAASGGRLHHRVDETLARGVDGDFGSQLSTDVRFLSERDVAITRAPCDPAI